MCEGGKGERCACVKVGGRKMCMSEGGEGWRCACVRMGTETDVNVEVVDLPHLTNHSDTLVGVQIYNCGGRNKSLNAVAHVHGGDMRLHTVQYVYMEESACTSCIQYVHVTVCSMLGIKIGET